MIHFSKSHSNMIIINKSLMKMFQLKKEFSLLANTSSILNKEKVIFNLLLIEVYILNLIYTT